MNFIDDDLNESQTLQNNKFILTNLSDLNLPDKENELIKIFKFFNINNLSEYTNNLQDESEEKKQKKLKKKQKIEYFLRNSVERTETLIELLTNLTNKKTCFGFKVLKDLLVNKNEKLENKTINYLKKFDFFEKTINNFNNKLKKMKENKEISQLIFKELITLKKNNFLVDENYKFPEISEKISSTLIYKICLNYESILGKEEIVNKFSFNLIYDTIKEKFEMKHNFYEKFIKKFNINFFLTLKFPGNKKIYLLDDILIV